MSRVEDFGSVANVAARFLSPEIENKRPAETQNPLAFDDAAARLGEFNNAGSMARTFLNGLFDRQAPQSAANPSPLNALNEIKALPKPNRESIQNLPPAERETAFRRRVQDYNQKRADISDAAINNSPPPKREDFSSLRGRIADVEYTDALQAYNGQISELKQISREAKQANLQSNAEFKKLPAETQQLVQQSLVKNQGNPTDVDTLARLAQSPGFSGLNAGEQRRLINFVGGTNVELSQGARTELRRILDDPNADKSNAQTFRQFLQNQPGLPFVVSGTIQPGEFDSRRRSYALTGPTEVQNHNFPSGADTAQRYDVAVGGRTIPVFIAANQDSNETYHTIDEVAKGLAALPARSLERVVSVSVDPHQNPDDAYWAQQYNMPNFRSYMTAGADGNIAIYPGRATQEVLDGSLIHETGHTLSKQRFGENTDNKIGDFFKHLFGKTTWSDWRGAMREDGISPSVYARQSAAQGAPDEDFSETLELYMKVRGTPQEAEIRTIMPKRFALLDRILK